MPENTTNLTPQDVIVGIAKGIGMQVPDTYTSAFGQSVMDTLEDKLNTYKAAQPMVLTLEYINQNAMNALTAEVARNLGIEQDLAATMIANAGDATTDLDASATPVSLIPNSGGNEETAPTTRTEIRTRTVTEPDRTLSAATREANRTAQTMLSQAIGKYNQLKDDDDPALAQMTRRDGQWDQASLNSLNGILDTLKEATGLSARFPDDGYTPELGRALTEKIADLSMIQRAKMSLVIDEDDRNTLFRTLNRLSSANELRPITMVEREIQETVEVPIDGTTTPQGGEETTTPQGGEETTTPQGGEETTTPQGGEETTTPQGGEETTTPQGGEETTTPVDPELEKAKAILVVEGVLSELGGQLDNLPGIGGMISQFGLTDTIITPLTEADLADDTFGANSQDLASKLIMGLKMLNGDENPDGTYNSAVGENLRLAIMTKPEFQFIRDQIKSADGTPLRMFGASGGALSGASAEEQQQLARALLTFDDTEPTAPGADATDEQKAQYQQDMQNRAQFEQTYQKDLEAVRQLNTFFQSMDVLQQQGVYDNEKARQTNQTNLMMSAASGLMDQWMPGLKGWLQDFFTNSEFGQMIGGILSQFFGINVGRLWGDNDDAAALERSQPLIEENFASFYNKAKEELGEGADHAAVMARTKDAIMDKMDGGAFKMAMGIIFKDQDEDVVRQAVEDALIAAQNSTDLANAQQVFSQSLLESGERFRGGATLDTEQLNAYLEETSREMQGLAASGFAVPGVGTPTDTTDPNATTPVTTGTETPLEVPAEDDNDGLQLGTSEAITAVVSPDGENRERESNAPAVDAEVIEAGDKNVELIYNPNNANQMSGPTRYAHGRVDDIQAVLGDNAEALGLSLNAAGMKNSDGVYTDMLTPYTNAVIEETLIRAQIHELEEQSTVITQDHLDNFDRKLTLENLNTVTTYLQDQGVSAADVAKLSEAVIGADGAGIGTDYFSTSNTDRTAGPRQEHTVLEQSHFGNQFDLKLAQWVPDAAPVETDLTGDDPLRDQYLEYNKDKPCEIPLFFTRPGDTSVFAIIRDKNGNDDPSDDKFVELDMDLYLSTHKIQDGDADDLKALLDNYNWENPTDRGVRDVINKVLGLEPFQRSINMRAPEVTVETNTTPDVPVIPLVVPERTAPQHDRPETIRDLRMVTDTQAAFLTEKLKLNDIPGVRETADRDVMHPLEVMFEQQMRNDRNPDGVIMLELDAHGISHPDMDVVLAYKNERGDLEFRFVDYETDAITPIPQQRQGNTDIVEGFDPQRHDYGARRLDDFIDEYERTPGGSVRWAQTDGYMGLMAIVPARGNGLNTITAFQAVYGESLSRTNSRDYVASVAERSAYRTGYEVEQRNGRVPMPNHERRNDGLSDAEKQRLDELARSGRVGTSGHYNDRSGHTHSHSHGSYSHTHPHSHDDEREYDATSTGLALKAYENTPAIIRGATTAGAAQIDALARIFKNGPFRGNNYTIDDFSPEEQERLHRIMQGVRENQGDMNANPTDPYDRPVEEFLHGHNMGGNR